MTAVHNFKKAIKSIFLHGLFSFLPLIITFGIIRFIFRFIKSTLQPLYNIEPTFLKQIPHAEIFVAFIVILLCGLIFEVALAEPLKKFEESILQRIPLLRQIYFGTKQLVASINPKKESLAFTKVVIIEFPRVGVYSLAFLTNEVTQTLSPQPHKRYYSVFVPHVPNPTAGHYIIIPETDFKEINITRQDALALIVSGGIIQPEHFINQSDQAHKSEGTL
jgi:uncharacterized membrane protein